MAEPRELVRVRMILTTFFLLFHRSSSASALPAASNSTAVGAICVPHERDALLDFKAGLTDPTNILSSWRGVDCCLWLGVDCSSRTGHVVGLEINSYILAMSIGGIGGEIRSSLLILRHLSSLDLSSNDFGGKPIPELIGGLRSLTFLDLSFSNFGGRIPPHIGNLSNLQELQLGLKTGSYSPDLTWVSRLTNLQFLGMTGVDLSAAVDWAHAINMLHNLIELELCSCGLQSPMSTPIHSNRTSLETLYLSYNPFNASLGNNFFVWALRSLHELDLTSCGIHGPMPDAVGNLTSLQHLYLDSNYFNVTVPLALKKLKKLQALDLANNFISMDFTELIHQLQSIELQELVFGR